MTLGVLVPATLRDFEESIQKALDLGGNSYTIANIEELIAKDRMRPFFLFQACGTREVAVSDLVSVDTELDSLMNLNRPEDYDAALARSGV